MPHSVTEAFSVEVSTRQAEAMRLRIRGLTLAQIAKELGYSSPAGAHVAIKAGMQHNLAPVADELRQLLCARYDTAYGEIRAEWEKCLTAGRRRNGEISKRALEVFDRMLRTLDRHAAAAGLPRQGDILPGLNDDEADSGVGEHAAPSPPKSREEQLRILLERLQARQANEAVDVTSVVDHVPKSVDTPCAPGESGSKSATVADLEGESAAGHTETPGQTV